MNEKITCPNCHLLVDSKLDVCPFCGEKIVVKNTEVKETKVASEVKKTKLPRHSLYYYIGAGLGLLLFLAMLIPGCMEIEYGSIYEIAFGSHSSYTTGTNAGTILFIFALFAILNYLALMVSIKNKTTEIKLFSYFTAVMYAVCALVSFLSGAMLSTGAGADSFTLGIGFIVTGLISLGATVIVVLGVISYSKYLVSNPIEQFKHE